MLMRQVRGAAETAAALAATKEVAKPGGVHGGSQP
jgi:hypothetical protein